MSTATLTRLDGALAKAVGMHAHQAKRIIGGKHNLWVCTVALFTPRGHTIIWGSPGVAKSMLFDGLLAHLPDMRVFKTPAFKGSSPEQFLGPVSIKQMVEHDEYVRKVKGKFAWAEYFFCDELLRTPRVVMPAFQTGMSDNLFDAGNGMEPIPLVTMFGATNSGVEAGDDDLQAFWDRFTFKLIQDPVQSQDARIEIAQAFLDRRLGDVQLRDDVPDQLMLTRDEVEAIIHASAQMPVERDTHEAWAQLQSNLLNAGIAPSIRRCNHILAAMQTDALLRGQNSVTVDNIQLAKDGLWTDLDERDQVFKEVLKFASDYEKHTASLVDDYEVETMGAQGPEPGMKDALVKLQADYAQTGSNGVTKEMTDGALKLARNWNALRPRLEAHIADAKGRDVSKLEAIIDEMESGRDWIQDKLMGGLSI